MGTYGIGPQVLVSMFPFTRESHFAYLWNWTPGFSFHVSIYQGKPFWGFPILDNRCHMPPMPQAESEKDASPPLTSLRSPYDLSKAMTEQRLGT